MALKINSLARGFSGIRRQVIEALVTLFNRQIYPVIPQKGSVGASGDLAPLSHMSAVLIGEGEAFVDGVRVPGSVAMRSAGLEPITLAPKEGLALLNGTQASTASRWKAYSPRRPVRLRHVAGSLSVEAALAAAPRSTPASTKCAATRPDRCRPAVPRFAGAQPIEQSHENCGSAGPYSLRCQPQ
ncbi:Histidine ammonia-lyase [Chromobacterium violaceum]|nr:Histidine ammonia-lyase [Chromobacterium violaceum]